MESVVECVCVCVSVCHRGEGWLNIAIGGARGYGMNRAR